MVDAWLVVLACIVPCIVVACSFYVLVYFQHPDDKNAAYLPKTLVVLGLSFAVIVVLMIPFDVANQAGILGCGTWNNNCGGIELRWIWQIIYLIIAVFVILLIPFTIYYYEAYEEDKSSGNQCLSALMWLIATTIVTVGILIVCYALLSTTEIPVKNANLSPDMFRQCPFVSDLALNASCSGGLINSNSSKIHYITPNAWSVISYTDDLINIQTTFIVYMTALMGFVGWFFFSIYTGIGFIALPVDLIKAFMYRPKYMDKAIYADAKLSISKRTTDLIDVGKKLQVELGYVTESGQSTNVKKRSSSVSTLNLRQRIKTNREEKALFNEFKQSVVQLEEDYSDLKMCHEGWNDYNPLIPYGKLCCGIFGILLSLLWVIHIILYMLIKDPYPDGVPASYFLNSLLSWASKEIDFTLLGTLIVSILCLYLLFCTVKGNFKFGLRFLIIEIHPMKYGKTYMSSFMVNVSLILLCTPPLVQFCAAAFSDYIVLTDVDTIFGQQITHMRFFRHFFANNVFVIAMLIVVVITLVYTILCPNDKNTRSAKDLRAKILKFKQMDEENKRASTKGSVVKDEGSPKSSGAFTKAATADATEINIV